MKRISIAVLSMAAVLLPARAQQALGISGPVLSPEVHSDKSVTFRLLAPEARQVYVTGDFLPVEIVHTAQGDRKVAGKREMTKSGNGVWEFTTGPLSPELYSYSMVVDGLKITDPSNVYQLRDIASLTNVFLIDGGQADYYKIKDVPHGTVSKVWYDSPSLGMARRLTVYTPAGYGKGDKRYPVFYLLHGKGGDENAWPELGRATQILDNMIASGEAEPMIVVMTNGNAAQQATPGESSLGFRQPTDNLPKTMDGSFERSFPEIVEFIDNNYRTKADKKDRAIAGLSMGGFHSMQISKEYPDMFDFVGLFSAALWLDRKTDSPVYADVESKLKTQFSNKPALYWIAIGDDDFLYDTNVKFRKHLDDNGYPYVYKESAGGHSWRNWRTYLTEFLPLLFR